MTTQNEPPYDKNPPKKAPDPKDGTRAGWEWCAGCCGIKEPGHAATCEREPHFVSPVERAE